MISAINLYLNQIIYCFNWAGFAAASGVESHGFPVKALFKNPTTFFGLQTNSTVEEFMGMLFLSLVPNIVFLPFSCSAPSGVPLNVVLEK